jgi:hypothetical protein
MWAGKRLELGFSNMKLCVETKKSELRNLNTQAENKAPTEQRNSTPQCTQCTPENPTLLVKCNIDSSDHNRSGLVHC